MGMSRQTPWSRAERCSTALILAAGLLAGCGKNVKDEFPLSAGFQPLEAVGPTVVWLAATATDPHPPGLGPVVAGPNNGHYTSYARGYLHAPLAKVYQALHDPAASLIHNQDGTPQLDGSLVPNPALGEEPFPVSFRVRYFTRATINTKFDVTYRAGPLEGTDAAPIVIGERYQKTWGTSYIRVMSGSLVATAVDGAPDVTSVEMVAWLNAETQGQVDCDGTLQDLFGDLEATLASMPP
jgi:hypothetical protein